MRVETLTLEGYGSYFGEHSFTLHNQGLVLVQGDNRDEPRMDSNGAAKSTIFEALDWCLFGVIPKGDHVDSVINDESAEVMVRAVLHDDERDVPLVIERRKARNKSVSLVYWLGETKCASLDVKETQRALHVELGLDRDVFHAAVFYAQGDVLNFAESNEARRMELLSKILPELRQIDEWLPLAKERAKIAFTHAQKAQEHVLTVRAQHEEAQRASVNWQAQVEAWEAQRQQRALAIMRGVEQHNERLAGLATRVHAGRDAAEKLRTLTPPTPPDLQFLNGKLFEAQQNQSSWRVHAQKAKEEIVRQQGRIQRLRAERSGQCSLCGQAITVDHMEREVAAVQSQVTAAGQDEAKALEAAKGWDATVADLQQQITAQQRQAEATHRSYAEHRAALEAQASEVARVENEATALQKTIADLREEHRALMSAPNPVQQQQAVGAQRIEQLQAEVWQAEQQAVAWRDEHGVCDFWVTAFGNKGLRNYVLDHRLREMTDAANQWVRLLTAGTIWVRFETQKMGRSTKKLSNEITIRVFRFQPDGKIVERNFKSWSGGEKKRVAWGIDFGLSRLIAARATKRYELLILDEVFRHVDAAGGEAVVEMLQALRRERSSIFVIEHDAAFQSHFEKTWCVIKEKARSWLVAGEGGSDGLREQKRPQAGGTVDGLQQDKTKKKRVPPSAPSKAQRRAVRGAR